MNNPQDIDNEIEHFPLEPRYHPANKLARSIYDLLASAKLAMLLLVAILFSCLIGVTVYRERQAAEMVFGTLWFNGLLVLLVINTACCFFGRMWRRRITVVNFGMILFHLSFVAMFLAIVANSLFSFEGTLRLTEGEALSNRDPKSYDIARHGLFFSYSRLKGETTLLQVHRGFKVNGDDKQIAFDVSIAEGGTTTNGTIYINNKLDHKGVEYIRDREGYSLLVVLNDRQGKELYGVHYPLQSFRQTNGSYNYSTGTMSGPAMINYPPEYEKPYFGLQIDYVADKQKDRSGEVKFQVWPAQTMNGAHPVTPQSGGSPHSAGSEYKEEHASAGSMGHSMKHSTDGVAGNMTAGEAMKPIAEGTVRIGEKFAFGGYELVVPEVRYWVAMNVRYNPGKPFVLASLCVGLAGIIITTIGRMMRSRR